MKRLTIITIAACWVTMMFSVKVNARITEFDIIVCNEAIKLARANVGVSGLMQVIAETNLTPKEVGFLISCYDTEMNEILREIKR